MPTCWSPVSPDTSTGKYLAEPGRTYAALLSVDHRASLSDVVKELGKQSLQVSYAWQSGQPVGQTDLADWLTALPPPTRGTVWMYFEGKYTGDLPRPIAKHIEKCILFICGSADVVSVFEAQACPPPAPASCPVCPVPLPPLPAPVCPPPPSGWGPAVLGAVVGALIGGTIVGWKRSR